VIPTTSVTTARALDAAGIREPGLRDAYETCRRLNALHGRTYYLATLLLPPAKRPYVHALYGFARYADEFVDDLAAPDPAGLLRWSDAALDSLRDGRGADPARDPVLAALADTLRRWDIPLATVEAFLTSMRMDIEVTSYATYADLERYMYGSAAVIGLQMLPILQPRPSYEDEAAARARALGEAFQLSNFIRDVAEDLDRGRVYLPLEDLDRFGVTRADLERRQITRADPRAARLRVDSRRALYRYAQGGVALLHPTSRPVPAHGDQPLRGNPRRGRAGAVRRVHSPARRADATAASRRRRAVAARGAGAARRRHLARAGLSGCARRSVARIACGAERSSALHAAAAPPHPPRQHLHDEREPEQQVLDRGPHHPSAEDHVVVVGHDAPSGEPAVGEQLEGHDDRVGGPEGAPAQQPGPQQEQVE
jgi:phytoene synthase